MSVIQNNLLMTPEGYQISRSVRLRSSASAYFNRTPASSGNRQIMTFSFWMKRGLLTYSSNYLMLFNAYPASSAIDMIGFSPSSDSLRVWFNGSTSADLITTQVFRDPSAWYHVVVAIDTTQATSSNRIKVYVNGTQITSFSTATYPTQNYNTYWNSSSYASAIGANLNGPQSYFDGYLTEINFVDGQALTPSSFGETDAVTGVWKPKKYAGTYGTNGFYLNFSDNSNNTATTIGKDYSGNGNNWTPNNISVTSGVTYDSMLDTPTPYADGGNGRGNYAVLNPLDATSGVTDTEANLKWTAGSPYNVVNRATIAVSSGKWYWEVTPTGTYGNFTWLGVVDATVSITNAGRTTSNGWYYAGFNGNKYNGSAVSYGATFGTGNVIGIALDMDAGTLTFYKDNTSQGVAFSTGLTGKTLSPALHDGAADASAYINFGQRPFAYTPPTGFKALNTQNLPDATIKQGNKYFDASLYTGNQTSLNVVNGGAFQPDLVWIKARSTASIHYLQDAVRGALNNLDSSSTGAEQAQGGTVTSFNSNGFSLGASNGPNASGTTYVGWQWKKGAAQGFDIVTYTGNGTNRTVAHSLGVVPKMVIVKNRSAAATNWPVFHGSVNSGVNPQNYVLFLNTTNAFQLSSAYWNNTAPTSSVFSVGTSADVNGNGNSMVAYCFAEVAGFSKIGTYVPNGSADGPFVYCGFKPRWIVIKYPTAGAVSWAIYDSARDAYNVQSAELLANTSGAEATLAAIDFLSNGFKIRTTSTDVNVSGGTQYIYAAFAENPFKHSLAR